MTSLSLQHVNKVFGHQTSRVQVLKDVNFATQAGEVSLVLGPSGSGKSTFLTIAGGIQTPTDGQVTVNDQTLSTLNAQQRDHLRLEHIGFVLQAYNLVPYLTVREQFALVDKVKPAGNLSRPELDALLEQLDIAQVAGQYPSELSGGQSQRVAIARALYQNPAIILADEPTAALDSQRVATVGQLFRDLAKAHNKAVVIVTHDLRLREFADRIYTLTDGQLQLDA